MKNGIVIVIIVIKFISFSDGIEGKVMNIAIKFSKYFITSIDFINESIPQYPENQLDISICSNEMFYVSLHYHIDLPVLISNMRSKES